MITIDWDDTPHKIGETVWVVSGDFETIEATIVEQEWMTTNKVHPVYYGLVDNETGKPITDPNTGNIYCADIYQTKEDAEAEVTNSLKGFPQYQIGDDFWLVDDNNEVQSVIVCKRTWFEHNTQCPVYYTARNNKTGSMHDVHFTEAYSTKEDAELVAGYKVGAAAKQVAKDSA